MTKMKIQVTLQLPEQFCIACESLNINDEQALQSFIDRVLVFSFLIEPYEAPESLASTIFGNYIKGLDIEAASDKVKRRINFRYIKQVVKLVGTNMDLAKKEIDYRKLIENWYADLTHLK